MNKVKIFVGDDVSKLEAKINSFLATPVKILQVAQTENIEPGMRLSQSAEFGVHTSLIWVTITIFYEEE